MTTIPAELMNVPTAQGIPITIETVLIAAVGIGIMIGGVVWAKLSKKAKIKKLREANEKLK